MSRPPPVGDPAAPVVTETESLPGSAEFAGPVDEAEPSPSADCEPSSVVPPARGSCASRGDAQHGGGRGRDRADRPERHGRRLSPAASVAPCAAAWPWPVPRGPRTTGLRGPDDDDDPEGRPLKVQTTVPGPEGDVRSPATAFLGRRWRGGVGAALAGAIAGPPMPRAGGVPSEHSCPPWRSAAVGLFRPLGRGQRQCLRPPNACARRPTHPVPLGAQAGAQLAHLRRTRHHRQTGGEAP